MTKVKTFLHILSESLLPQANYYKKLIKTKFNFSLKYFFVLVFVSNFIFFIFFLFRINPQRIVYFKNLLSKALSNFPENLKIYIRNGNLLTNGNKPYFLWFDEEGKKTLLLVIDETATADEVNQYGSFALLASNNIVLNKTKLNLERNTIPYEKMNTVLGKETFLAMQQLLTGLFPWLVFFFILFFIFMFPVFIALTYLIYLLFVSLVAFLIFKFFYKKHKFKKTYQISLHAVTLPLIVEYAVNYFALNAQGRIFRFLLFILALIFILSGLYEAYLDSSSKRA